MKKKTFILTLILSLSVVFAAHAEEPSTSERLKRQAKAGGLGGPGSVGAQLEEDRSARQMSSRWSGLDKALDVVVSATDAFYERTKLQLGLRYTASYQSASSSLTDEDDGAAGQIRLPGKWRLYEQDENNYGNLVFLVENRHSIGDGVPPASLSGEIGSFGPTGLSYGDNGTALTVAFWEQSLADRRMGIWAGRIDPTDLTDILGYANQRTTFSNASVVANLVVVAPGPGFGLGVGGMITDHIYSIGTITDANGSFSDIEWFPGGSEFYKYAEVGWLPSREERYTRNIHIGTFHMDERSDAGTEDAHGFLVSANWLIGENWLPFARAGISGGDGAAVDKSFTIGTLFRPDWFNDLIGFGINWLEPTNPASQDQTSAELFYRFSLSRDLAITFSAQSIFNPANNPQDDEIAIFGVRMRLAI
ncbi:MAG: carbohydrate porin [Anaerolineales bacterium]